MSTGDVVTGNVVRMARWGSGVLGFGLLLALLPAPVQAQTGDATTPVASAGKQADQEELPVLFLIERRPSSAPALRDDPNFLVQSALQTILNDSGKYTLYTYSPYLTFLKEGILHHSLETSDLEEPLKPASIHRIAALVGARSILIFHTTPDKNGIRTDVSYEVLAAQQTWRTAVTNQFHTDSTLGKRKLKLEEVAQINADSIAKNLGIPSHLLDKLHLEVALKPLPAPNTSKPKKDRSAATNTAVGTVPANPGGQPQTPANGTTTGAGTTGAGTTGAGTNGAATTGAGTADTGADPTTATSQPTVPQTPEDFGLGNKKGGKNKAAKPNPDMGFPQTGGGISTQSSIPAQVISEQNVTNVDRAARYKQSGDSISAILYLRRAINDAPNDLDLRRQLIQTYQDNQMPEMAVAEIGRSLLLDPKNSALYRLYGDSLYSLGNGSEALKAYQEAVRLNPDDVAAQIALGDIQLHNGQLEDALKTYRDAAANAPKSALPHRRMARVALQRAYADPGQYAVSIEEIKKARSLSLPNDTATYLTDYALLLRILQSRLLDLVDQMDAAYNASQKGAGNKDDTLRHVADLKERASAVADYLDALPSATGEEGVQALYQEGAVSLITTLGYFKSFVEKRDSQFEDKMNSEKLNARHDINTAGMRLQSSLPNAKQGIEEQH